MLWGAVRGRGVGSFIFTGGFGGRVGDVVDVDVQADEEEGAEQGGAVGLQEEEG